MASFEMLGDDVVGDAGQEEVLSDDDVISGQYEDVLLQTEKNHQGDSVDNNLSNIPLEEPKVGMEFDSPDDLLAYYIAYARQQGFAVAKRSSRKGNDKKLRDVAYECNKRGKARRTGKISFFPRPQTKLGCNAHITASVFPDGKWRVRIVDNSHNHEQSPGKSRYFNCNRVLDRHTRRRLELNDAAGIRQNKTIDSLQLEVGALDNLPFTSRDCRNYLAKVRRLRLCEGDAEAMHRYFMKMKADNSEFFYAMDLDEDGRLKNVFWADARSRAACKEFGDIVTFDTTYLVNKYDMPFAPFVGVNHHGQSILLGCGLLSHEDTESFSWLFETWMTCMWGCAPKAIITDQCMAMKNAIEEIFPDTRHRWCIWHIMKKVPEKLSGYKEYERISWSMRKVVYDTLTIEEFEAAWGEFVIKYKIQENTWLQSLYLERKRWVPAYVKDVFWAGMSSTQRSEGINAYFDGYINSKTTLKQFVEQYEIALKRKVENEKEADARSWDSYIPCITKDKLEEQFQSAYTHNKFREFQEQFSKKLQCHLGDVFGDMHVVKEWVRIGESEEEERVCFKVVFNPETNEASCNCRLFEFRGMVCKHQLMVWNDMGVKKVPEKYILKRWCKNVRRAHTKVRINYDPSTRGIEAKRHDTLCDLFKEVAYLVEDSQERYDRLLKQVHELKREFEEDAGVCGSKMVGQTDDLVARVDVNDVSCSIVDGDGPLKQSAPIRDPMPSKAKGRPRKRRLESHVDKVVKDLKRKHFQKKTKVSKKKKQSNDTTKAGAGTQHDIINVTPYPLGMAPIESCYNTSQSFMELLDNQASCGGYNRGGYLATTADAESPNTSAPSFQVHPSFDAHQRMHLMHPQSYTVQNQQKQLLHFPPHGWRDQPPTA